MVIADGLARCQARARCTCVLAVHVAMVGKQSRRAGEQAGRRFQVGAALWLGDWDDIRRLKLGQQPHLRHVLGSVYF